MGERGDGLHGAINHEEALQLAAIRRDNSNLARCYIDLDARLARLLRIEAAAREVAMFSNEAHLDGCDHNSGPPGPFPCDCKLPAAMDALRLALRSGERENNT